MIYTLNIVPNGNIKLYKANGVTINDSMVGTGTGTGTGGVLAAALLSIFQIQKSVIKKASNTQS